MRSEAGVPELPENAPEWQRILEGAAAAYMSPGVERIATGVKEAPGVVKSLIGSTLGTWGSDIGGYLGGEGGSLVGGLLGATATDPVAKVGAKWIGPKLADPTAKSSWTSAEAARPTTPGGNFQGLTLPALGNRDWSQFTPGFISLASPVGQRIAGALRFIPWSGKPIDEGVTDTSDFIQAGRDAAAHEMAGQRGIPPEAGPSTIGPVLTEGAQRAITQLYNEQNRAWNAQHARMSAPGGPPGSAEVPLPNTVNTAISEVANQRRGDPETAATNAATQQILDVSPGIGHNSSRFAANPPPLPALPSMPWSRVNDWVQGLTKTLDQGGSGMPSDIADTLKKVANAERERAAEAAMPGGGSVFRRLNENYAKYVDLKDQLAKLAGQNLGGTGRFINAPGEGAASGLVTTKLQSPSDPLMQALQIPAFPADARMNVAGQIASRLGNVGKPGTVGGGFRPEQFVNDYTGAKPGLTELAQDQHGNVSAGMDTLENMRNVAQNFSPKTSRTGLQQTLGTSGAVIKALELASRGIELASGWKGTGYTPLPWLARGAANALESDPLKRAMAGQPQKWWEVGSTLPISGGVTETSPPTAWRPHTVTVTR